MSRLAATFQVIFNRKPRRDGGAAPLAGAPGAGGGGRAPGGPCSPWTTSPAPSGCTRRPHPLGGPLGGGVPAVAAGLADGAHEPHVLQDQGQARQAERGVHHDEGQLHAGAERQHLGAPGLAGEHHHQQRLLGAEAARGGGEQAPEAPRNHHGQRRRGGGGHAEGDQEGPRRADAAAPADHLVTQDGSPVARRGTQDGQAAAELVPELAHPPPQHHEEGQDERGDEERPERVPQREGQVERRDLREPDARQDPRGERPDEQPGRDEHIDDRLAHQAARERRVAGVRDGPAHQVHLHQVAGSGREHRVHADAGAVRPERRPVLDLLAGERRRQDVLPPARAEGQVRDPQPGGQDQEPPVDGGKPLAERLDGVDEGADRIHAA